MREILTQTRLIPWGNRVVTDRRQNGATITASILDTISL